MKMVIVLLRKQNGKNSFQKILVNVNVDFVVFTIIFFHRDCI